MGKCCSKKTAPEETEQMMATDRKCTDLLLLLMFLMFWAGMVAVMMIGIMNGDVDKLTYGTDYEGNVCFKGKNEGLQYAHYPRTNEDIIAMLGSESLSTPKVHHVYHFNFPLLSSRLRNPFFLFFYRIFTSFLLFPPVYS